MTALTPLDAHSLENSNKPQNLVTNEINSLLDNTFAGKSRNSLIAGIEEDEDMAFMTPHEIGGQNSMHHNHHFSTTIRNTY